MRRRRGSKKVSSQENSVSRSAWIRPSDWLPMPTIVSGDKKIAILCAVSDTAHNYVAFGVTASNGITVDWGDGSATENFASGVTASHDYSYADADLNGTECSRGYKQAIIQITPQSGGDMTVFSARTLHPNATGYTGKPYLEIHISSPEMTGCSLSQAPNGSFTTAPMLENVHIIGTNSITSLSASLQHAKSLESFKMDYSSSLTNMDSTFYYCFALRYVNIPDTSHVTTFAYTFAECYGLETIPNFSYASATSLNNMFFYCYSLRKFTGTLPAATTIQQMFGYCHSLEYVADNFLTSSVCTDASYVFRDCFSLKKAPKMNLSAATTIQALFYGAYSIKEAPDYSLKTSGAVTATQMFYNCRSLTRAPNMNTERVTSMATMFNQCQSLQTSPVYDLSTCTTVSSMYLSCTALKEGPAHTNTASVSDWSSMYSGCSSLRSVPTYTTTAATNASGMFTNCYSLIKIPAFNFSSVSGSLGSFAYPSGARSCDATGIGQTISIRDSCFDATSLDAMYTLLGTVTSKTITVTGNPGVSGDTPSIATAKGWTVTG